VNSKRTPRAAKCPRCLGAGTIPLNVYVGEYKTQPCPKCSKRPKRPKRTPRADASRRAFVVSPAIDHDIVDMHEIRNWMWKAWQAGAKWQRRQRGNL
jgi:hypothetical protein